METLIWTDPGLGQYYIRLVLGQILPRSREESRQQGLTESSVKGKTWIYREGNLTMEEYTAPPSLTAGGAGGTPPGFTREETGSTRRL